MTDSISSAIATATGGLLDNTSRLDRAARRIAAGKEDPTQPAIDLLTARNGFDANAAVIRTANRMQKRLLDIIS